MKMYYYCDCRLKVMPTKKILAIREGRLARLALVESDCRRLMRKQKSEYPRHSRKICRSSSSGEVAPPSRNKSPELLPVWLLLLYKYVSISFDVLRLLKH